MERARRFYASAAAVGLVVALAAALGAAGCGSSSSSGTETSGARSASPPSGRAPAGAAVHGCAAAVRSLGALRVAGVACSPAVEVASAWARKSGCSLAAGASRGACTAGGYRCLATATAHGVAVSCSRPGRSVSFVARRG